MLKFFIVRGKTKLFSQMLLNNVERHSTNFVSFGGHFVRFTANFPEKDCAHHSGVLHYIVFSICRKAEQERGKVGGGT